MFIIAHVTGHRYQRLIMTFSMKMRYKPPVGIYIYTTNIVL